MIRITALPDPYQGETRATFSSYYLAAGLAMVSRNTDSYRATTLYGGLACSVSSCQGFSSTVCPSA